MQNYSNAVIARPDTLLGVCQALGGDLGFNPIYLRVALAVPLVWMPVQMFAIYLALGALVLVTRLAFPNPRLASATPQEIEAALPEPKPAEAERERDELLLAA
jgi:hypothetical protein